MMYNDRKKCGLPPISWAPPKRQPSADSPFSGSEASALLAPLPGHGLA